MYVLITSIYLLLEYYLWYPKYTVYTKIIKTLLSFDTYSNAFGKTHNKIFNCTQQKDSKSKLYLIWHKRTDTKYCLITISPDGLLLSMTYHQTVGEDLQINIMFQRLCVILQFIDKMKAT